MSGEGVALPRWKCHKEVWGDRIKEIRELGPNDELFSTEDSGLRWILDCGGRISVKRSLIGRGRPVVGDYYVRYEDGYESWSPAKAFEDGYTRIS